MLAQALGDLEGQVQAGKFGVVALDEFDDAQALRVVVEPAVALHEPVERFLAGVAEGRVAQVVREGDGFGEVFVERRARGRWCG